MKQTITVLVFALIVGFAAALFRPAVPHQVPAPQATVFIPRGGSSSLSSTFVDAGLDNEEIETDSNITPSRKCGFCMGWAGQTNCPGMCDKVMMLCWFWFLVCANLMIIIYSLTLPPIPCIKIILIDFCFLLFLRVRIPPPPRQPTFFYSPPYFFSSNTYSKRLIAAVPAVGDQRVGVGWS
jgi:hypothetical protein